jgi:hypothetical protein
MERCEHGEPLTEACEACGRYEDGSDGTSAGEHRAAVKRWQAELAEGERRRRLDAGEEGDDDAR